jgi:multiple sugar transport system substrate-binding protein
VENPASGARQSDRIDRGFVEDIMLPTELEDHAATSAPATRTVSHVSRRALLSIALASPIAVACGGATGGTSGDAAPKSTAQPITLRHAPWPGIPSSRAAQTGIAQAWNERHPEAPVKEEEYAGTGSHYEKLLIQAAAGASPDMTFMQGSYDYVSFVAKDLLLPIDALIKKDRSFNATERLHPRSRDIVDLLGHTWGLPVEAATYVIFYNRDLFDKAGVPLPKKGWTWQDLLDRAQRLTRDLGGDQQYGYSQNLVFGRMEPWIVQNGARLLDKVAFAAAQKLDSAEVVAAIQLVHDLAWKHRVMPAGTESTNISKMWEGKHAMRQDGSWLAVDFAQNMKAPWGIAPLPKGKQDASWMSIDINVAFKSTKHPDASYEYLKFANRDGQKWMIEHWARMPVTFTEDAKQTYIKYLKNLGLDDWQTSWDAWQTGYISHLTPAWPDLDREVIVPAFSALFGKDGAKESVPAVFRSLAAKAQQILTEKGAAPKL